MVDQLAIAPVDRHLAILRAIDQAQHRLWLSVFRCNDDAVIAGLERAVARGVQVSALLTRTAKGPRYKLKVCRKRLERAGVDVTRYEDPVVKYHAKYIVVDEGPAVVTTLNLTRKCFRQTFDAVLTTYDTAVVKGLQRLFAADAQQPRAATPSDLPDRLVVSPEAARERLTSLLTQANRRIRIIDHKLDDPAMLALLRARERDGIEVQVLGASQLAGMKSHGRVILVDGSIAVLGSIALRALHLEFRREVGIVVADPEIVWQLEQTFEAALCAQPAGAASLQAPGMPA